MLTEDGRIIGRRREGAVAKYITALGVLLAALTPPGDRPAPRWEPRLCPRCRRRARRHARSIWT